MTRMADATGASRRISVDSAWARPASATSSTRSPTRTPARSSTPPGRAASATSTPLRTTGWDCRTPARRGAGRVTRETSSCSPPRSVGCWTDPGDAPSGLDDEGFVVPADHRAGLGSQPGRGPALAVRQPGADRHGLDRHRLPARPRRVRPRGRRRDGHAGPGRGQGGRAGPRGRHRLQVRRGAGGRRPHRTLRPDHGRRTADHPGRPAEPS